MSALLARVLERASGARNSGHPAAPPPPGTRLHRDDPRLIGGFRLVRRLGAGGMGVVYLGVNSQRRRVALKVIRPELAGNREFRSRFAREVEAARRIRSGCIARLVAADLETDHPWFATQYVSGPSLYAHVTEHGPMSIEDAALHGARIAAGLESVHAAGVVHRDLKPSNILLSPKGPRIIDFGIAWSTGSSALTHVGTAVGSPGFLAPEQVRGNPVTAATDVFTLASTLVFATTGESPFGHGSSEAMLYRVVHEEPDLATVPTPLREALGACLAKEPAERPTAQELADFLHEVAGTAALPATNTTRERPRSPTPPPPQTPVAAPTRAPRNRGPDPRVQRSRRRIVADPQLLLQRLVVFVSVTLLISLGLAATQ
ncbi:serine/threonine-protein kinase [Streptomyces fractus]|uniref:serine/threonine-protein kinase n=1 Tax=Streptomyces fractus TaxID=641806 RepID=UPI003CF1B2A0